MSISISEVAAESRGQCPEELGFGGVFSDHLFSQRFDAERGWHDASIAPFHDFTLHPAAAVLHYGQEIFEGLKAYRRPDGGVNLFRPDANIRRFNASAERMVMLDHLSGGRAILGLAVDSRARNTVTSGSRWTRRADVSTKRRR